ncbi:MAG TPA: aminotransferase class V-fold PLP-dependent enzyme [Anaeromyxobacteraceae bacterium]|nr:aminotransferase class V-fold PLP-dependent enzyme [Anaeromyxobacteraceae bacterium]
MPTFDEVSAWIRGAELGAGTVIATPFGERRLAYADLTASGRALGFVEARVAEALPLYANVHSATSTAGRATSALREQARRAVARGVGAGPDDVVLFVGSGATAAVNKLVGLLGLRLPEPLEREFGLSRAIPAGRRPVVLAGPYEHHSNELPWLESIAEVVEVELRDDGTIDLEDLRRKAAACRDRPLRIGAISAASNVTGVLTDVRAVCRVLHAEGALACVDYAAAGPYVPIDMHPADPDERIDAIFVSTHKFMGGPGASGILVAHRALFRSRVPERPGGGTVDYVGPADAAAPCQAASGARPGGPLGVDYAPRLTEREEGGTPNILGDVRAGLVFELRDLLGPERILAHETELARRACARLGRHPRLRLLGPGGGPRLPILSFDVEGLHHELAATLLDHLFGIQSRAGCSCAGPYGHRLLGIGPERSARFRRLIRAGLLGAKPGWVRLSLPYHASEEDVAFLLDAVELVADEGEAFVPLYRFSWRDGSWCIQDIAQAISVSPIYFIRCKNLPKA